jgi:Flp pilus assembly protein TadG
MMTVRCSMLVFRSRLSRMVGPLRQHWRAIEDSGVVAVEAALTYPIFALFLYGILELGHYAYTHLAVMDAAQDGARYAIVRGSASATPATSSTITSYIRGRVPLLDPAQTNVSVTFTPNDSPGSLVKVQVSYPFAPFMPGFGYLLSQTVTSFSQMTIAQ